MTIVEEAYSFLKGFPTCTLTRLEEKVKAVVLDDMMPGERPVKDACAGVRLICGNRRTARHSGTSDGWVVLVLYVA